MTRLIVARHGNTFDPGDTILRVGARTDLPLSASGRLQAEQLGKTLLQAGLVPDVVFSAPLKRTIQTAQGALAAMQCERLLQLAPELTEIDYGPDDGQPETAVVARLGAAALRDWEEKQIVPNGWLVDGAALRQVWLGLAERIRSEYQDKTVLCLTSNGVARFALALTAVQSEANTPAKLATGAYGILEMAAHGWQLTGWNIRPPST